MCAARVGNAFVVYVSWASNLEARVRDHDKNDSECRPKTHERDTKVTRHTEKTDNDNDTEQEEYGTQTQIRRDTGTGMGMEEHIFLNPYIHV